MVFSTGGLVCKEGPCMVPGVVGRGREGVKGSLHILNINGKQHI